MKLSRVERQAIHDYPNKKPSVLIRCDLVAMGFGLPRWNWLLPWRAFSYQRKALVLVVNQLYSDPIEYIKRLHELPET